MEEGLALYAQEQGLNCYIRIKQNPVKPLTFAKTAGKNNLD
jgi:hypothetical protein